MRADRTSGRSLGRIEASGAVLASLGVGLGITLAGWFLLQEGPAEAPAATAVEMPAVSAAFGPPRPPAAAPIVPASYTPHRASAAEPAAQAADPSEPEAARVVEGQLKRGDTVASILRRAGVGPAVVSRIAQELAPYFDFRRARPGDRYRVALAEEGTLLSFHYRVSPLEAYQVIADGDDWFASSEEIELQRRHARVAGLVTGNLYDSILDLGGPAQLASDFASIFAWDLDFNRSVQPGDEFRILYEKLFRSDQSGSDVLVGPGRILAARYENDDHTHTAVYFETQEGRGGYYRPNGQSVERMFLAAPLRYRRISSSYNPARLHPILKVRRPHFGIDYAAPVGAPVWSVGDGTVIFRGRAGGFGRLVKVRHSNGYVSYYAHLSRYAKGLHVGQVVRQKQVIGYVGTSGLSTGPHVCFRIQKDGRYVNPARLRTPAGDPIPAELLPEFEQTRNALLTELIPPPLVATDEAL